MVAAGDAVDPAVRFLATLTLKNAVNRQWRPRRGGGGVGDGEKAALRPRLLSLALADASPPVALQLAVTVARVARFDHPREWPDLLPALAAAAASSPTAGPARGRAYLLLHHTLKELASRRLGADVRAFEAAAASLADGVWAHWCEDTAALGASLAANGAAGALQELAERWRLETKALRRLAVHGVASDARTGAAAPLAGRLAPALLSALPSLAPAPDAAARALKLLAALQAEHPWTFRGCGALAAAVAAAAHAVAAPPGSPGAPHPQVALRWMQLLRGSLAAPAYRAPPAAGVIAPDADTSRGGAPETAARAAAAAELAAALPADALAALAHALLTWHMPLCPTDVDAWRADPEGWHHSQAAVDGGAALDEARPAAEALLVALLASRREELAPALLPMLRSAAAACPAAALAAAPHGAPPPPEALRAEAALGALGACAYELHDYVDFGEWWHAVVKPLLAGRGAGAGAPLLRRRAAALLGCWASKVPELALGEAYAALSSSLSDDPDAAARLAAAAALRVLLEDWSFSEAAFAPLAPAALGGLLRLAATSAELDSAALALAAVAAAADRLREAVAPLAPALLAAVPALWAGAEGHALLRLQLLQTLCRFVSALGAASPAAWPVLVPLLAAAANPSGPEADALAEDALALWLSTLRAAPAGPPGCAAPLLPLLPLLAAHLRGSWEHLAPACRIAMAYILLDGGTALHAHGAELAERLAAAVGAVAERGALMLLPVADAALRAFPADVPALLDGLLRRLFAAALGDADATGGSDRVAAHACALLGRVLLGNPSAFLALANAASAAGLGRGDALLALLDAWSERMDSLASFGLRRLSALALCALLASGHPHGVARLDDVAALVSGVLAEEAELRGCAAGAPWDGADAAAMAPTWPVWDEAYAGGGDPCEEGLEAERRAAAAAADPAATADVAQAFRAALAAAVAAHGRDAVAATLGRVDAHILAQLQAHTGAITL